MSEPLLTDDELLDADTRAAMLAYTDDMTRADALRAIRLSGLRAVERAVIERMQRATGEPAVAQRWLAVAAGVDTVRLLPVPAGSCGPDVFVRLTDVPPTTPQPAAPVVDDAAIARALDAWRTWRYNTEDDRMRAALIAAVGGEK